VPPARAPYVATTPLSGGVSRPRPARLRDDIPVASRISGSKNVAIGQVQLYKLIARQVAAQMDLTASFLPKPVANVNGNGCHTSGAG